MVLTFFLLSFGVLLLDGATAGWSTSHLFCVYRSSLKDPLFYIRLFGHVLGHADLDHFLNNMLLFLVIGPPMEEKYGSLPLLKAIVLTAFVSGLLQCILFPGVALLGASGIVFMLIMLSSLSGGTGPDLRHPLRAGRRGQLHAHRGRRLRHRLRLLLRPRPTAQKQKEKIEWTPHTTPRPWRLLMKSAG